MTQVSDFVRLPYLGWEVRSRLTHASHDGTVAAAAALHLQEACKCHLMSSRQFGQRDDALRAHRSEGGALDRPTRSTYKDAL